MEELLRLDGAVLKADGMEALRDYALEVCRGDIVYVQGVPGSGARALVSLLAGECALQAGRLYLDAQRIPTPSRLALWQHGLYAITAEKDLVEGMSVAENLEAIRYLPNCLRIYRHEESKAKVAAFLRGQGIDVPSGAMVWSLSRGDRVRLSLLKARIHGARLIVLDATEDYYEGGEARALCEMIRRQNREGVSFVIVSECFSPFAQIATRIQLIDRGRDMKEWPGLTPHIEALLRGLLPRRDEKREADGRRLFRGIYDYAWDRQESFLAYLRRLREENPELWRTYLGIDVPQEGVCCCGDTVVIPAGSEDRKVGFSPVMMSSEFFAGMADEMEAYFTANGMKFSTADANGDVQTQIQNIENFVQMDMDYIIMFAVDASAICDAAIAARNQGKLVINIGTVLEQRDAYDVCINVDQFDSGAVVSQMAAEWIEKTFPDAEDGSVEVAIIEERDSDDAIRRSDGLHEIEKLTSKAKIIYVAEQIITDGATKAQELADALFLQHPDVKCILTYGTDIAQGSDEIALQKVENKDQFAIFTVDTPEFIRGKIKESADNTSMIRGTVMLGEGTPYTCYKLMDGSWMDRVVDGVYAERCIAITLDTMSQYFPE